jgi:hypothetical protein
MSDKDTFHEKHLEYSKLTKYPPFTISLKKAREFGNDFLKEEDRIFSEVDSGNEDAWARAFSTMEVKWDDDIEEARLYQKRYGDNILEARKAAMKLNNLTEDDKDVPLFI